MAQKQRHNHRQTQSSIQEPKRRQGQVTDLYVRQFQDASYEERQAEMQLDLGELDVLDDSVEESPDIQEDSDFNSEMSFEDEDAVREEHQEYESVPASGECVEEGGFESDVDAIYILPRLYGTSRCLVEEDVGRWANHRSQSSKDGEATSPYEEPPWTTCYRAIAKWLEEDFQDVLCNPEKLLKRLEYTSRMTREDFCKGKTFDSSQLSRALKDAKIIWPDYAIPMDLLFKRSKNR